MLAFTTRSTVRTAVGFHYTSYQSSNCIRLFRSQRNSVGYSSFQTTGLNINGSKTRLKDYWNFDISLRYSSSTPPASPPELKTNNSTEISSDTTSQSSLSYSEKTLAILKTLPSKTLTFVINLPVFIPTIPGLLVKLWPKIKHEIHHYWVGSKLFVLQARTAFGIIRGLTQGKTLTRKERKILINTFNDFLRLIPFAIIVLVPFMELALPILLKIFPNMLPSTFEDKLKKEEDMKKNLKARIGFAKFLQDATEELIKSKPKKNEAGEEVDLGKIMKKVKEGEPVSNEEILQFATAFSDELTIDNLQRPQLVNMCKYMNINTLGTDTMLRFQLNQKLRHLKNDDQLIQREGIDSLSIEELQSALRARGMRGTSTSKLVLRRRLSEWLDLSLTHALPASVLILSRAMVITEKATYEEKLKETLSKLPDDLVEEVKLKFDESHGKVSSDLKYEVLKSQKQQVDEEGAEEEKKQQDVPPSKAEAKLKDIGEAVSVLSSPSLVKERQELNKLRADHDELQKATSKTIAETVKDIREITVATPEKKEAVIEDELGKRLQDRLTQMVNKLEQEVEKVESAVGLKLNVLDKDKDGVISVDELAEALNLMRDKLSEERVQDIISKVDRDHDGKISLEELIAYVDEHTSKGTTDEEKK